jgi:uncharacterized membrane protein YphA (DoxX/SURF4 family)
MFDLPQDPALLLIARLCLAAIFLMGGFHKLSAIDRFVGVVLNYKILPDALIIPFAYGLPALELATAAALAIEPLRLIGVALALLLILAVTAGVIVNLRRGRTEIDCGCGGGAEQPLSGALVIRNMGLIALALYAASPVAERALGIADIALVGFGALVGLGLYIAINQASANWSRMQARAR